MPLYEYQCECGEQKELLRAYKDRDAPMRCPCGGVSHRLVSRSSFKLGYSPTPHDRAKDIWEGTPLEGTDGINAAHYRSTKVQVDLSRPRTQHRKVKPSKHGAAQALVRGEPLNV